MCNVCPFLLMSDISMRSFIDEDIHVTHCKVSYPVVHGLVAVLLPFQQYLSNIRTMEM